MPHKTSLLFFCLVILSLSSGLIAADAKQSKKEEPPQSLDPRLKIELFAADPQIATPTGIDVDEAGRVWVIESNTHFPPEGYSRYKTDRIFVMQDTNGDGKADKIVTFTDGLIHTMSVAVQPMWLKKIISKKTKIAPTNASVVYAATRKEIFLLQDTNGDLKADSKKSLIQLETADDYPHNGLAGFALKADGWIYFGLGENHGAGYKLTDAEGTVFKGKEGGGGSVFRCLPDGTKMTRWATGFWNPHASCVDAFGRLFSVDNDPHARPPCRLLHVVKNGDYGFQNGYGSNGVHPFTSWNGETAGTLPMVAGTGEAPSGVVAYESDGLPKEYVGNLLSTSWGDHRIERFRLKPKGASFTSKLEPLIVGGENFRPVGIATAPDGSLYISDWVLREYKIHGKGRVWRISMKKPVKRKVIETVVLNEKTENKILRQAIRSPQMPRRRLAALLLAETDGRFLMHAVRTQNVPLRTRYEALAAWKHQDDNSNDRLINMQRSTTNSAPYHSFHTEVSRYSGERPQVMDFLELLKQPGESDPEYLRLSVESTNPLIKILARSQSRVAVTLLNRLLEKNDPFIFSKVVQLMIEAFDEAACEKTINSDAKLSSQLRLAVVLAARNKFPKSKTLLKAAIPRKEQLIQRAVVQWIAEEGMKEFRPSLLQMLENRNITNNLFEATLAAIQIIDGKKRERHDQELGATFALSIAGNKKFAPGVRARALQIVPPNYKELNNELIEEFLQSKETSMVLAGLRTLQITPRKNLTRHLLKIAADKNQDSIIRADALVSLSATSANDNKEFITLLTKISTSRNKVLQAEGLRAMRVLSDDKSVVSLLEKNAFSTDQQLADLAKKALGQKTKPTALKDLMQGGNALAGRRIFYHSKSAGCYKCHTVNRRGGKVGPDLSLVARSMDRKKLAESILDPSREVAPQFSQWTFVMLNGKVHSGMIIGEGNKTYIKVGLADGKTISLKAADIDEKTQQKKSVMPDKLPELLTKQEFLDLLAFLETLK